MDLLAKAVTVCVAIDIINVVIAMKRMVRPRVHTSSLALDAPTLEKHHDDVDAAVTCLFHPRSHPLEIRRIETIERAGGRMKIRLPPNFNTTLGMCGINLCQERGRRQIARYELALEVIGGDKNYHVSTCMSEDCLNLGIGYLQVIAAHHWREAIKVCKTDGFTGEVCCFVELPGRHRMEVFR